MVKKQVLIAIMILVCTLPFLLGSALRTKMASYSVLATCADVNDVPDTSLLSDVSAYTINGIDKSFDLKKLAGAGTETYANGIEIIFTLADDAGGSVDANDLTATFELYGAVDNGPRQLLCTIALTSGTAQYTAGSETVHWVDTAVVTSYHYKGTTDAITVSDSGNNRIARVTMDAVGLRYLEGRFTGEASTAGAATAYLRYY